jgi:hypothetical protein
MTEKRSAKDLIRLLRNLQHHPEAQRRTAPEAELTPRLAELRSWQSERLRRTYADLLADPQYRLACEFFLNDVYASQDFSQRDYDAERLHSILSEFLPESALQLLTDTIELNRLSAQLDQTLAEALESEAGPTPQAYARAYRKCNNFAERRRQIEMLARVLREAASGARGPVFSVSFRLARLPAQRAGWIDLYGFLERGYAACKPMRDVATFVDTIYSRETEILNKIFSGADDPFGKSY